METIALDNESLLKEIEQLRQIQKDLEAKRYIETSQAMFAAVMRWTSEETLESWADRLLMELTPYISGLQACLYNVTTHEKNGQKLLQRIGVYAYEDNEGSATFEFGKGLVGQSAKSKRPFLIRTDGSNNKLNCKTGIASIQPEILLIQPLISNENVEGVLEISLLRELKKEEAELLNQLSEAIATNLMTIRSQDLMKSMYEQAQQATLSLQAQEEELRQNMEEMEATQEEMKRQQLELNGQIEAINNIFATIEFDMNGTILKANNIFLKTLKYTMEEIINQHHSMFVDLEYAKSQEYKEFWNKLKSGEAFIGEILRLAKDGSEVWLNATYTPVKDKDNVPIKVIKLATDITESKKMQIEIEKKKMKN